MSTQFGRSAVVIVDSLRVSGLRIQFKAEKTSKPEPNTLDLSITNLKRETRNAMQKKHAKVVVLAGYGADVKQVFSGDARTVDHVRQGPDWVTRIQCGDGERAWLYGRVNTSLSPGAGLLGIVKAISATMGIGTGNAEQEIKKGRLRGGLDSFVSGVSLFGKGSTELDRVLRSAGFEWSIQDGQLQLIREGGASDDSVVDLTPKSGLIGSPQHGSPDKKGAPSVLKARCLLRPEIRPGRKVSIRSADVSGVFRAEKVVHLGDTSGPEFFTDLECLPL